MARDAAIALAGIMILRLGIGALFVYAGLLKAMDPSQFLQDIESYGLIAYSPAAAVALYLPYLEILAGSSVILKRAYSGGLLVLLCLTFVFTLALSAAWLRGLDISCGCFGTSGGTADYPWLFTRDCLILGSLGVLKSQENIVPRS
jgi:putative oxidoreductase